VQRNLLTAALTLTIIFGFAASASAKVLDTGSGTGFAAARGEMTKPRKLSVYVTASPSQRIDVQWDFTCWGKGFKFAFRDGTIKVGSGTTFQLPRPLKHPTKCHLNASALQTDFSVSPFLFIRLSGTR
jgi:hypothetical protein